MESATATAPAALESFNPATGERLGSVPALAPDAVQTVVDDVAELQPFWAQLPLLDRAAYMRRAAQAIIDDLEGLARLLSREQGKPIAESYSMELLPTIDGLHWIADNGPELLADEDVPMRQLFVRQKSAWLAYQPLGVVAVIAPWNYPWSIPFGEVAVALMCGNGVVLKPASLTPLIGQRIQSVFERAGVPDGLVRCVHGGAAVGQALVDSTVAKVFFTGSVETGRRVAASCAEQVKGCVLELGGKDPQIVLADAPLGHAVSGSLWGGFANAGQTCSGIERVYVAREVADEFIDGVVRGAKALRVGNPLDPATEIGPMVSEQQFDLVRELVDDAVASGAEQLCGGPLDMQSMAGRFFAPAVLTGVTPEMRIMREEIFGPVLPIVTVDSEEEAIQLANGSAFGLGASVWTCDRDKGARIARRLEAGMVWMNDHMFSHGVMQCAWGGVKESGLGRVHGKFGFYECVNVKQVTWDPARRRNFWWYPYDASLPRALDAAATLLYGRDTQKPGALRRGLVPLARLVAKSLRR
ncbi:MAG: aldehyde dehydrogenase family protein [Thermoleophilaceae bacterium]